MADLKPLYKEMAARGANFHGLSILQHQEAIAGLIQRTGSRTLLDYGAGGGMAYEPPYELHLAWGVERPALYDPAFPMHDTVPDAVFDGVVCSDVLEHVPEDQVDALIADLFAHASSFVWASVCCRAAKKKFLDGTNLHVTVKPFFWWLERFNKTAAGRFFWLTETP